MSDDVWRALADESRRQILQRLRSGSATAGELGEGLAMSQPAVSKHLRVLRDAGVVTVAQDGRTRIYSLALEPLVDIGQWFEPYRVLWRQRMDALSTEISRGKRDRRTAEPTPSVSERQQPNPSEESA